MEISYKREMNHNYMVIAPDWEGAGGYESRMLFCNAIAGTLKFRLKQTDNKPLFYYEITSRQPLRRVIEKRYVQPEEIRRLLIHIASVLKRLEQYLVPESRMLLDPEYIYVEPDTFEIDLCVVPAYEGDFSESFTKLLQYLMEKVDHQDRDSVVLAYRLYHESLKENYGIEKLLEVLTEPGEKTEEEDAKEELPEMKEEKLRETAAPEPEPMKQSGRGKREPVWKRGFLRIFFGRTKKAAEKTRNPVPESWRLMLEEEISEPDMPQSENEKSCQAYTEPPLGMTTELLADFSEESSKVYLMPENASGDKIVIKYVPFIIGKSEDMADGCLKRPTVSRLHARIDCKENVYILTDLNSTNGTVVEGYRLEANETVSLKDGDRVILADAAFRFVEKGW